MSETEYKNYLMKQQQMQQEEDTPVEEDNMLEEQSEALTALFTHARLWRTCTPRNGRHTRIQNMFAHRTSAERHAWSKRS